MNACKLVDMGSVPACMSSRADGPVSPPASPDCPHPQWARHKDHIVGVTWLKLEAAELDSGSAYEARLRVQMAALEGEVAEEERYEGVWSDWSQSRRRLGWGEEERGEVGGQGLS